MLLDYVGSRPGSGSGAFCISLTLLTGGGVLIFAASSLLAEHLIVLAFALLGICIIAFVRGVAIDGAMPALAIGLPSLMLMGYQTTEKVHWHAFALTASAPFTLALTLPMLRGPKWLLAFVRLVLVLIPLVLAIWIAQKAGLPTLEEDGE
jgi:hypothetical protein